MKTLLILGALVATAVAPRPARAEALSLQAVDRVIEQADRAVQACGRTLPRGTDQIAVLVQLTIDGNGHVAEATASGGRAGACLERVARKLTFPAIGATSHLAFPFVLVPRR